MEIVGFFISWTLYRNGAVIAIANGDCWCGVGKCLLSQTVVQTIISEIKEDVVKASCDRRHELPKDASEYHLHIDALLPLPA